MSNFADAAAFAQDPEVQPIIAAAIAASAIEIFYEDDTVEGHEARQRMASAVLANPPGLASMFAWAISTNPTVVGKWINDDKEGAEGDFAYVLSTVWNAVSGA